MSGAPSTPPQLKSAVAHQSPQSGAIKPFGAVGLGITINGLPILNEEPDLDAYYRAFVIGGNGAFCVPARDYRDFREAIRDKLVREIRFVA